MSNIESEPWTQGTNLQGPEGRADGDKGGKTGNGLKKKYKCPMNGQQGGY